MIFHKKAREFFYRQLEEFQKENLKIILVTHILPDKIDFLDALSKIGDIAAIIPKQKSIDGKTLRDIKKKYAIFSHLTRIHLRDKHTTISFLKFVTKDSPFIILDIGGYFSPSVNIIKDTFGDYFLGVVEDTENGHIKYKGIKRLRCPVFSVARSPNKYAEDILVGYSTVYSAEYILRARGEILVGKNVTVIGYGKIGRNIARDLVAKRARVNVYDKDPKKMIHAMAEGHSIISKEEALKQSDILFCITGNKSLNNDDLEKIKRECYIFSITSQDDEFSLNNKHKFREKPFTPVGVSLIKGKTKIHLVNYGNAINFLHNAVISDFIYLVQGEILLAIKELLTKTNRIGKISEISNEKRNKLAEKWIDVFAFNR